MSFLTGTAPKASFDTASTTSTTQQSLLSYLSDLLTGSTGSDATTLGTTSLTSLENNALNIPTTATGQQTTATNNAFNTLNTGLSYTAPTVTAPLIDPATSKSAFTTGVVEPLTTKFLERTLPAIAGNQGGSAGGAYGSGAAAARRQAGTDLETTLSQTGATYAYDTAAYNAGAQLTASLANQKAGLTAEGLDLSALSTAPATTVLPETTTGSNLALGSSSLSPFLTYLTDLLGGGTTATQTTTGVGSGGSTGLLGSLLTGTGSALSGGGLTSLLALSDERVKEEIEEVGEVEGFPLYRFKYKGRPERHIGMMAQDVEKRLPEAVGRVGPYKTVNYATVIERLLEAA